MNWRHLIPWVHLVTFWPLAGWYLGRVMDRGDEPWALLALVTALVVIGMERRRRPVASVPLPPDRRASPSLLPAALVTLVYAATYGFLPPLVRAGLAVTALALSVSACWLGRPLHIGLWGLMVLSLPVMLTVEFYAGYPLRVAVTWVAAKLLGLTGVTAVAQGAVLAWNGIQVAVDAPCAGIRLLWVGAYLTLTLICLCRLSFRRALVAGGGAFAVVLVGNICRTAALFFVESGMIMGPDWLHVAVGVVAFAGVATGIAVLVSLLADKGVVVAGDGVDSKGTAPAVWPLPMLCGWGMLFRAGCLLAALVPFVPERNAVPVSGFPGWPETFEGRRLQPVAASAREAEFARTFPGAMGSFSDGQRCIVMRWVNRPSRQLHPIETCFKGQGYSIKPEPLYVDGGGDCWGVFRAMRGAEDLRVRTRIYDGQGSAWQDMSSWFWAAALKKSPGPWWAVTVVEREPRLAVAGGFGPRTLDHRLFPPKADPPSAEGY